MSNESSAPAQAASDVVSKPRAPLHLRIAGNGLLLNGHFEHWVPVIMDATNDAEGSFQLLVDVTSITSPSRAGAVTGETADLFSFTSRQVKGNGPMSYLVRGTFRAEGTDHAVEAIVEVPSSHTPFFLITFSVPRQELPELWRALEEGVARKSTAAPGDVRASAWLRAPDVAAA